ncbi:MAG TPA: hypothetical protein DGG94_01235 [Micromonosporaceae bacterium]|nr:hypothetical protein [Micromonosporaceae bacterium]HCU48452.1 hypothetical protein [Micromonosporaceae bacterium]
MTSDWHPFLLVRPGGLPFLDEIRGDLLEADLLCDNETTVRGWRAISRRLYYNQYGLPGTPWLLQEGAEAWLATSVALFGDNAVFVEFAVGSTADQRTAVAQSLADYKRRYRARRREQRAQISVTFTGQTRQWPVYFDGVHVPEPQPGRIAWELTVIRGHVTDASLPFVLNVEAR